MPPTLRSSATTPSIGASTASTSSPHTTPRKVHCCTKCGRPKAGHPRTGCPYVATANNEEHNGRSQEPELADALSFLQLAPPVDDKAAVRARRCAGTAQLEEASAPSTLAVSQHDRPPQDQHLHYQQHSGIMTIRDQYSPDGREYGVTQRVQVVSWQEGVEAAVRNGHHTQLSPPQHSYRQPLQPQPTFVASSVPAGRPQLRARSVMPGTLHTPNASFFESPTGSSPSEEYVQPQTQPQSPDYTPQATPPPLARSLSVLERDAFLNGLMQAGHAPPAAVFAMHMDEIYQIQHAAAKVNFYSRVVPNIEGGENGWLILGSDHQAVQLLFEGVSARGRDRPTANGGRLSAVAGGAVIGAVATFTGLAFS